MISRRTSGVQRSAKISEARAIGQNCPYPAMTEVWPPRGSAASTNLEAATPLLGLGGDGGRPEISGHETKIRAARFGFRRYVGGSGGRACQRAGGCPSQP